MLVDNVSKNGNLLLNIVQRPDGSMMSKPLEDLWPFLDRAEFRANMLIEPIEES